MEFNNPIVRRLVVTDGTRSVTIDTIGTLAQILFELLGVDVGRLSVDSSISPPDFVIDGIFNGNNFTRIRFVPGSSFIRIEATNGTASQDSHLYIEANSNGRITRPLVATDNTGGTIPESWHAISYNQGIAVPWTNVGSPYANVGYRFMPDGTVLLRGLANMGTKADFTTFATLPVGYRPSWETWLGVNGNAAGVTPTVVIFTNGNMQIFRAGAATAVSFDNIRFPLGAI